MSERSVLMTIMNEMKRTETHNEQALKAPNQRYTEFRERKKKTVVAWQNLDRPARHTVWILLHAIAKTLLCCHYPHWKRLMKLWPLSSAQKSVDSRPEKGNFVID